MYIGVTVRNGSASLTLVDTETGDTTTSDPVDVYPPSSKCSDLTSQYCFRNCTFMRTSIFLLMR